MYRFGFADLQSEISGNCVHRLENVLTLEMNAHYLFDNLKMWFEATVSDASSSSLVASQLELFGRTRYMNITLNFYDHIINLSIPRRL